MLYFLDDRNVIDSQRKEIRPSLSMKNAYPKKFALIDLPGTG